LKEGHNKLLLIIITLLLILASGSVIHLFYGAALTFLLTFLLIILFTRSLLCLNVNLVKRFIVSEVILFAFLGINYISVIYENDLLAYGSLFLRASLVNMFLFYIIHQKINFSVVLYKSLKIIIILSGLNVILSFPLFPFAKETSGIIFIKTFYFIFNYQSEFDIMGFKLLRNQGVFWEPGILAIYANLFVFYTILLKKKTHWLIAGVITVISTFSTTGLFLLFSQAIYFFFMLKANKLTKLLSLGFLFLFVIYFLVPNFNEKIQGSGYASFDLRTFDALNAFNIFLNHPVFGIGIDQNVYLKLYDKYQVAENFSFIYDVYSEIRGNSNSILMIFVSFGAINAMFFFKQFFNSQFVSEHSKLFYFIIFISLFSEPLILSNFFLLIPLFSFYKS
jgi:hypothetical protein